MTRDVETLRNEVAYRRERLERARAAYRRSPNDARYVRWLTDAANTLEDALEELEKAEATQISTAK